MTATAENKTGTTDQAGLPPRGDWFVRLMLGVATALATGAFALTIAAFSNAGYWMPQTYPEPVKLVVAAFLSAVLLVPALIRARYHFVSAAALCALAMVPCLYITVRMSLLAAHGYHDSMHTPWMKAWTTCVDRTIWSALCSWGTVAALVVAAVVTVRVRKFASMPLPGPAAAAPAEDSAPAGSGAA